MVCFFLCSSLELSLTVQWRSLHPACVSSLPIAKASPPSYLNSPYSSVLPLLIFSIFKLALHPTTPKSHHLLPLNPNPNLLHFLQHPRAHRRSPPPASAPTLGGDVVRFAVKRDLSGIVSNLKLVVFPDPYREDPGKARRDWGLWGPFFFIVFLGLTLSWSASVKKGSNIL